MSVNMHAQFILPPSLVKVNVLFEKVTGCALSAGVSWGRWLPHVSDDLESFRKYIRPSHYRVLDDTIAGRYDNPCSFLRQVMRPHNLTIRRVGTLWQVFSISPEGSESDESPKTSTRRISLTTTIEWK